MKSTEMVDYTLVREDNTSKFLRTSRQESKVTEDPAETFWWRKSAMDVSDLRIAELPRKPLYEVSKRILDVTLSLLFLLLGLPVFIAIAIAIKATSPGPVLFKQKRIGKGGIEFMNYKFRTMVADAELQLMKRTDLKEQFLENFKIKDDPRITKIGAFLRKTSLDETPQFLNVIKGDISLIGPRALQWAEIARYGDNIGKVLAVQAGLSGWWQVRGRNDTTYSERVQMDVQYVEQRSLWLDIKLIFETAISVLKRRGAY